jgi:small subunit ribosomal protein S17
MAGKIFEGTVTSDKMQKTLVVSVSRKFREERTGKIMSSREKYKIHCENTDIKKGDLIRFTECRPMSADKRFRFVELVKKGDVLSESTVDETA